ncbi:MAG: nucleotide sugar dehydrogenase [Bdellovibrionota bacterium]|nr:nucleotide sugar dehydrogenase [Bdellovibrionota bacterium]
MRKISVIGLGYVGLPVAVEFGKASEVIGFDINSRRIDELKEGFDRNNEVSKEELSSTKINYTSSVEELSSANFHIVTVPTPITESNIPDLSILKAASKTVGQVLKKGDIVVFESTVYPGATEEVCLPILEEVSKLKLNEDFQLGYSPERINPGDKEHTFTKILKIVSGSSEDALNTIAKTYESVVKAGVHRASSIKVAEAAKVIENTQRDINIAFMNELAIIFDKLEIDTKEVLKAASTKWNFLNFYPGLVGGHCIGVDPYYLTHKAESIGYHPQVILSGRKINDNMGKYVAQKVIKKLINNNVDVCKANVTILGITFKENTPDIRNSKVIDIIDELKSYNVNIQISDPLAMNDEIEEEYGLSLTFYQDLKKADCVILAVKHRESIELKTDDIKNLLKGDSSLVVGINTHLSLNDFENQNINAWYL